jgi:hypothetical protein
MVENTMAYFYPEDLDSAARASVLLDMLSTRSSKVILSNMRKAPSLTLWILKSLYPRVDLDTTNEGFVVTCTEEEANKLVEDSVVMETQVIEMLPVDMS